MNRKLFFGCLLLSEFFLFTNLCFAQNTNVIINEIAWMGTENSSSNEWLEFFNISTSSVDISEWSIYGADSGNCLNFSDADGVNNTVILPNSFLLYANNQNIFNDISADIWDASIGLNNSNPGEVILFNNLNCTNGTGTIIDEVKNNEQWLAGNSSENKTMARIDLLNWGDSKNSGGTPGTANLIADIGTTTNFDSSDDNAEKNEQDDNSQPIINKSDNIIRYKSYSPKSVLINEIVSNPDKGKNEWVEIILNSNNDINLSNWKIIDASGAKTKIDGTLTNNNRIKVIEGINGNLNNNGDEITLRDGLGNIIDHLTYGENSAKNIPAPPHSSSLALYNGKFYLTKHITKGKDNIIEKISDKDKTEPEVVINEILPNPNGSDTKKEFIELYNKSNQDYDLNNWYLENKIGQKFVFGLYDFNNKIDGYILKSKEYLTIFRKDSYIALNNNLDVIKLFNNHNSLIDKIGYEHAKSGLSYSSVLNLNYNKIGTSTRNFLLHSIDKSDFVWSVIKTPNSYNIIKTENHAPIIDFSFPDNIVTNTNVLFDSSDTFDVDGDKMHFTWYFDNLKINLPLVNHIFLKSGIFDVKLEVSDGKNKSVLIKKIKVCDKYPCNFKKNLSNKKIIRDNAEDKKIDILKTEIEKLKKENKKIKNVDKNFNKKIVKNRIQTVNDIKFIELKNIRNISNIGDNIITIGVVSVPPGVLGSQFFYISKVGGLQVYSYVKDFPELKLGDYVEVKGEIGERLGERYLNIKNGNIRILAEGKKIMVSKISCNQISDETIGILATVDGKIINKKENHLFIKDNTGKIEVYIKSSTKINLKNMSNGEKWSITGIISKYKNNFRILPRNKNDLQKATTSNLFQNDNDRINLNNQQNDNADVSSSMLILSSSNKERIFLKYTFIILGIILTILSFFIFLS